MASEFPRNRIAYGVPFDPKTGKPVEVSIRIPIPRSSSQTIPQSKPLSNKSRDSFEQLDADPRGGTSKNGEVGPSTQSKYEIVRKVEIVTRPLGQLASTAQRLLSKKERPDQKLKAMKTSGSNSSGEFEEVFFHNNDSKLPSASSSQVALPESNLGTMAKEALKNLGNFMQQLHNS